ncbi:MAG: DUF2071 domain-containing protein [Dehalococcoidia bacterium]|nr:DUF2071 domain-containing protein [Dehalococcoidia bacterium]
MTAADAVAAAAPPAPFLTARWKHLLMLNWAVDPRVLRPRVPRGVELDLEQGVCYVSLVGFLFRDTKLRGVAVPFHTDFEEVNLRFYTKRETPSGTRRAVTFIKEIVPKPAIAIVARLAYNEPYIALPMRSQPSLWTRDQLAAGQPVQYAWWHERRWAFMRARTTGSPVVPPEGSHEYFIAQHLWGYTTQRNGATLEYGVQHPVWRVWPVNGVEVSVNFGALYGPEFAELGHRPPESAFVAEGSPVLVQVGEIVAEPGASADRRGRVRVR